MKREKDAKRLARLIRERTALNKPDREELRLAFKKCLFFVGTFGLTDLIHRYAPEAKAALTKEIA